MECVFPDKLTLNFGLEENIIREKIFERAFCELHKAYTVNRCSCTDERTHIWNFMGIRIDVKRFRITMKRFTLEKMFSIFN